MSADEIDESLIAEAIENDSKHGIRLPDGFEYADVEQLDAGGVTDQDVQDVEAALMSDVQIVALLSNLVQSLSRFAARRVGDMWIVDSEEGDALASAMLPVIDKYLPKDMISEEVALIVVAGAVFTPKYQSYLSDRDRRVIEGNNGNQSESEPAKQARALSGDDRGGQVNGVAQSSVWDSNEPTEAEG